MGKKRKTYKEKLISDLRRKQNRYEGAMTSSFQVSASVETVPQNPNQELIQNQIGERQPTRLAIAQYPYLLKDITKTAILTASIIAIQILIFIILRNRILVFPGVTY